MKSRKETNRIILHCTATTRSDWITVGEVRKWHKKRGFSDIGYHYLIDAKGLSHQGRALMLEGAHALGHNEDSIGIVMVGGVDITGEPEFNFSKAQLNTQHYLIECLQSYFGGGLEVIGHNEVSSRACPCYNVKEMYS